MPTVALSPHEAEEAFNLLSDTTNKQGQLLVFTEPGQLFSIAAITYHHSFEMKKTLNNSSKKYEPILDTAEPFG